MSLQNDDGQWAIPGKNYSSTRYSSLGQDQHRERQAAQAGLDASRPARSAGTRASRWSSATTMYLHSAFPNHVYALDLSKEGAPIKWAYTPKQDERAVPVGLLRPRPPRRELRRGQDPVRHAGRPGHRARRQHGQGSLEDQERGSRQGRDDDHGGARDQGQVHRRRLRRWSSACGAGSPRTASATASSSGRPSAWGPTRTSSSPPISTRRTRTTARRVWAPARGRAIMWKTGGRHDAGAGTPTTPT